MSAPPPPPPTPKHLIRSHGAHVNVVCFSDDNERILSGDAAGVVVVTSTRSLRALANWKAHTDGLLGLQEFEDQIITHGRDNKVHVWKAVYEPARSLGGSAALPGLQTPQLCYSLDVNALNFFPNLVESSHADIWTLPGKQRLHAAIGKEGRTASASDGRDVRNAIGIIMSMHLMSAPHPHMTGRTRLRLLCAYENGSVTMREYTREDKEVSIEGMGWDVLWSVKQHVESVMAMAVSKDNSFALTVSADHLIGRYNLAHAERSETREAACTVYRTKHPGNASVAMRDDGRVCAVGGWDGRVRLYSTKSFKPLGTLSYHKKNCQSIAFARSQPESHPHMGPEGDDEDENEMSEVEKEERARWLVSGGQDSRVAIWTLIDFGTT